MDHVKLVEVAAWLLELFSSQDGQNLLVRGRQGARDDKLRGALMYVWKEFP